MVSHLSTSLVESTIDEVALEGLDGITLEALWLRLAYRLHKTLPLPEAFMSQIWSICVQVKDFTFFELQEPREPLVVFDRYEFVDADLGIILEPETVPVDIYPHFPIHDVKNNIKGSCSTYYTRQDKTTNVRNLTLHEVTKRYGQKLVIVASQSARDYALMGVEICPILELNVTRYCFLERVGRSRYHGEVTQGKLSLNALKEDPKSLFYHRKFLLRHKLITKQIHHQKSSGYSCNGSLLHLTRFHVERKPKVIFLAEQVIDILKSKPNYFAEYDEIKRKLQIENSIKKLFKTSFFQKVVRTDLSVPYRTLYPNAEPSEWQHKNNPTKERMIRVVQLLVPDIDIVEVWSKDEIQDDDDPQELDISNHKFNVPYMKQVNCVIEVCKSDGVYQGSLARKMGLTKLQSRTLLRNMVRTKIVATYMDDMGRQRLARFVSKRFEKESKISKQFKKEMHKIKKLTGKFTAKNDHVIKRKEIVDHREKPIEREQLCADVKNGNTNFINENIVQPVSSATELIETFNVINQILSKYRLTKFVSKYRYTFHNIHDSINKDQTNEQNKNVDNTLLLLSERSSKQKAALLYENIKTELTALKSLSTRKPMNEIFGFLEDVQNSEKNKVSNITYRLLRRANMIIESVTEHQVIDDMTKLMKMIHDEEDKEGYDVKIDKKSLIRLLQKLAKDNLVKNIKLTLSANGKEKNITFICDPNIDINHAVIQSAVEQAKLKFCLLASQKNKAIIQKQGDKVDSSKETIRITDNMSKFKEKLYLKQLSASPTRSKYDPKAARRYGYSPKFVRMQALHIFLFYLVYGHPGEPTVSKKKIIQVLRANGFIITDEVAEELNTIYTTDVGWKMFVPPLPKHSGWPDGWTLMCDVLLRIPLSIFLKIHHVPFFIRELDDYLQHPIKRHYLVRDLPIDIRNSLLFGRKYIFNIHQTVTRLCYIGLAQFGPQKLKEKDQVFIYLNRKAELMDTTSSAPGYHIIEDKQYPIFKYQFDEIQIVEKYWYDMWNTCINTQLGGRLAVQGKDILLEDLSKKADMIKTISARSPEEAIILDTGQTPGDRKGAAGIDSACFAHLKRNWNWGLTNSDISTCRHSRKNQLKNGTTYERDAYLSKIKAKPLKFTEFSGLKKLSGPASLTAVDLKRKSRYHKKEEETITQQKYEALTSHRATKQKSFVRRVLPRKRQSRRRTKYDEIDYRALQRMHKLRVDWEPHEDKILLVCKVAMMYLCPNPRKQIVTFTAVRDVLRSYSFTSYNKTSRACQRRLLYMLRQSQTVNSVALGVEEIKQNFFISKRFNGITEKLKEQCKNSCEYEKKIEDVFKMLVEYVAKKYYDISEIGPKEPLPLPMTVQEFTIFYKVVYPTKPFSNRGFTRDVQNINDIQSATINSVIHSSMCCGKDKRSWAYQLFKIYQQYPEILLRNAMNKIRADQMVTVKKNHMCAVKKYGNYMPMSSSQHQLSTHYIYKFQTKWPYDILRESYDVFHKLVYWYSQHKIESNNVVGEYNGIEILPITGGIIAAIHDYMIQNQIDFDIEIPDQVIMLDSRLKEKDETYFRIAQRYQDVLASLDHLKLVNEPVSHDNEKITKFPTREYSNARGSSKSNKGNIENNVLHEFKTEKTLVKNNKGLTEYDFIHSDSDENSRNVIEEDTNIINFQDGTKIVLSKDDIKGKCVSEDYITGSQEVYTLQPRCKILENKAFIKEVNSTNQRFENVKYGSVPLEFIGTMETDVSLSSCKRFRDSDEWTLKISEPLHKKAKLSHQTENMVEISIDESWKSNTITTNIIPKTILSDSLTENEEKMKNTECGIKGHQDTGLKSIVHNYNKQETKVDNENPNVLKLQRSIKNTSTRVSDILRNTFSENTYLNPYCKFDDTSDIQKRYTRIALLRMREELSDLTVADSHHAHEYFVVNMFKIFYSLQMWNENAFARTICDFKGFSLPMALMPLRISAVSELLCEINRFSIFPREIISYADCKRMFTKKTSQDSNNIDLIHKFVRKKKEVGATIKELQDKFQEDLGEELYNIVSFLSDNHIFLRSGVTTTRYIHFCYVDPWLIHSYKIFRLEKESISPVPKGAVYITESDTPKNKMIIDNQIHCDKPSNDHENLSNDQSSNDEEERDVHTKIILKRKINCVSQQKTVSGTATQYNSNSGEEVRVVIKPWIRVDGVLNRRVLDRMLGAVLTYCLTHPGIPLTEVQYRFVPALQPFHTRELVEMLVKLECLEIKVFNKPRITLFSKPSTTRPRNVNRELTTEEDVILEPAVGAILKFSIFLSTKLYRSDFIA